MRPSLVSSPPLREEQPLHTSPSPSPPNLILWTGSDEETDRSYDSSQLQPSPSMMSVASAIPDLRPSGSTISSVNKLGTLPVSSSMLTLTTRTSLSRLASPALRPSESSSSPALQLSSSSSSIMPSAETVSSFSSSFSDDVSSPSQPSLSPSSIVSLPLPAEPEIDEEPMVGRAPRTISTLLDTAYASVRSASHSPTPIPIPPRTLPEGTIVMSVSTPYGSGGTASEQASLRTVSERPLPPIPRDFPLELDRLAKDLRGSNDVREQESQGIVDSVRALRVELQGLSEYSRSRPPNIVRIVARPIAPDPRPMESRSVGGSTEIAALRHSSPEEVPESVGAALTRASSITSVGSFLSSHYSDDLSLYEYATSPVPSISDMETESEDESSFVSSSEVTESEVMPETPAQIMPPLPIPPPEIMPISSDRSSSQPTRTVPGAPLISVDWMAQFSAIRDQLDNLVNKQAAAVRKMDSLRAPEYPEIPEIHHKIDRVEDLVHDLIQKFDSRPPQPVMVPVPIHQPTLVPPEPRPPSQAATIHDQLSYRTQTA